MFEAVSAFGTTGLSVGIVSATPAVHLKLALIMLMVIGKVEIIPFLYGDKNKGQSNMILKYRSTTKATNFYMIFSY